MQVIWRMWGKVPWVITLDKELKDDLKMFVIFISQALFPTSNQHSWNEQQISPRKDFTVMPTQNCQAMKYKPESKTVPKDYIMTPVRQESTPRSN